MTNFKLLLVEDDSGDIQTFQDTIRRYIYSKQINIDYEIAKNLDEAKEKIKSSFDAAIIDLRLNNNPSEGNNVLKEIRDNLLRIPCVYFTGTPSAVSEENFLKIFKKGTDGVVYDDILDYLLSVYDTGLTRILGGKGLIEEHLNKVFWTNINPNIESWINHAQGDEVNKNNTEKSLLRFMVYCIEELINQDLEKSLAEEMYLMPNISQNIKTGAILKKKSSNEYFIILTPECDLVIRESGSCNTDRVLLCQIEPFSNIENGLFTGDESGNKKQKRDNYRQNKKSNYHYLPKFNGFDGGLVNFRFILTETLESCKNNDDFEYIFKITFPFVKDILSRFSSYYARQGQPDLHFERIMPELS